MHVGTGEKMATLLDQKSTRVGQQKLGRANITAGTERTQLIIDVMLKCFWLVWLLYFNHFALSIFGLFKFIKFPSYLILLLQIYFFSQISAYEAGLWQSFLMSSADLCEKAAEDSFKYLFTINAIYRAADFND